MLCEGQTLLVDVTNINADYRWQDGSTNSYFKIENQGKYAVKVSENGCDTAGSVNVGYMTKPEINIGKDTTLCITQQLLVNAYYPQSKYIWQDGSDQPQFNITKAGTYSVEVANICGLISKTIIVDYENCACKFFVPNVFTPNNDGKNDVFRPKYTCLFSHYQLQIFNRWGQLVFVSQDPDSGWNGNYKSEALPIGGYVWEMSYTDNLTGKLFHKNGTVLLLR